MEAYLAQLSAKVNQSAANVTGSSSGPGDEFVDTVLSSLDIFKNVILSISIIVFFYLIGKIIAGRIVNALQKAQGESLYEDMVILVNRLVVFGSISIGIAIDIQFIFGLDFLQVLGFFGLGISFAFKDLLENLIAGAAIIVQNRFRIGDFIQIGSGDIKGKIMEIQTRVTILKAIDGTEIIIPNSELMMNPVTSFTAHHSRRISFDVNIDFDADLKKAIKVAKEVMSSNEYVLKKPGPQVIVSRIGESTIALSIRFWVDPKNKEKSWLITKSELIAEVKEAFEREGILIPYPLYSYLDKKREQKKENDASAISGGESLKKD